MDDETDGPLHFDAVLQPHRSLGPRGFMLVMGFICVISFIAGVVFTAMGAWPVFGFFGLDVLAIYIAFRLNFRAARLREQVRLSTNLLQITRILPNGLNQVWRFNPYWARIGPAGSGDGDGVAVRSHGDAVVLGRFLTMDEQQDFAVALEGALSKARAASAPQA